MKSQTIYASSRLQQKAEQKTATSWSDGVLHVNRHWSLIGLGIVVVAAFGACWGYLALGSTALDISNLKWLSGDLAVVFIAWGQYLSDPAANWLSTTRMSYPLPISVSVFDTMPVLLLLVRPFAGLVSGGHQFLGYYFMACLMLQGAFGYFAALRALMLIHEKNHLLSTYIAVIVGILFASIPYTSFRFQGHTALSSQWVLALSIWATLATLESSRRRWMLINGLVLFVVTGLNPYLALMVAVSSSVVVSFGWRKHGFKDVTLRIVFLVLVMAAGLTGFGFMGAASAVSEGYGYYSMNMLGPLDSNGIAGLFRLDVPDPTGGQSFEGFTYLGLGLLLLVALALFSFVNYRAPANEFPFVPAFIAIASFYLIALSSTVTLSTHTWHLPVPDVVNYLLSRFRASGRFFWMGGFWLILVAVVASVLRFGALRAAALLTIVLSVQLVDIRPIALYLRDSIAQFNALELSGVAVDGANSILVYPPWQCDHEGTPGGLRNYELVGYFALHHKMPTNNFYAARTPAEQSAYHCDHEARLAQLDLNAIYLLSSNLYARHAAAFTGRFSCSKHTVDGESKGPFWMCDPVRQR